MKLIFCVLLLVKFTFGSPSSEVNQEQKLDCDSICHINATTGYGTLTRFNQCVCSSEPMKDSLLKLSSDYETKSNTTEKIINEDKEEEKETGNRKRRDTLQDILKKRSKHLHLTPRTPALLPTQKPRKLLTVDKPKKDLFSKKLITTKNTEKYLKPTARLNVEPKGHKELHERFKELQARMHPRLKSRGDFSAETKPSLLEEIKARQAEFKEKIKNINPKTPVDLNSIAKNTKAPKLKLTRQSKKTKIIAENNSKEETKTGNSEGQSEKIVSSSTTESAKISHIPVIVLTPSSTTAMPLRTSSVDGPKKHESDGKIELATALEKLKEKQQEVVMKIKDKFAKGISKDIEHVKEQ